MLFVCIQRVVGLLTFFSPSQKLGSEASTTFSNETFSLQALACLIKLYNLLQVIGHTQFTSAFMFRLDDPTDDANICREIMARKVRKTRRNDPVSAINGDDRFRGASETLADEDVRKARPLSTSCVQTSLLKCPSKINTLRADKIHKKQDSFFRCRFERSFQRENR